jgi:hypothetical protein
MCGTPCGSREHRSSGAGATTVSIGILLVLLARRLSHRAYGPYALCDTLFNVSRRLILRAYCVVKMIEDVCALLAVGAIWVVIVLLFAAIGRRRAQRSAMHQTHDAVAEAYEMAKIAWIIPGVTFGGISLWFFEKVFDGSPAGIMLGWLTWIALSALLRLCWMRCSIFGRRNATAGRIGAWLMVYVLATCFVAVAVGTSDDASRGVWILCLIWMFSSLVIPGICRSLCPAIVVGRESADDTSTCSRANIFFALFHLVVVCVAASVGAFWDF